MINVASLKGHVRAVVAGMARVMHETCAVVAEMAGVMDESSDVGCTVQTVLQGALEMLA